MKTMLKILTLLISFGAIGQTIINYQNNQIVLNFEEEEEKMQLLMDVAKQLKTEKVDFEVLLPEVQVNFPNIKSEKDFKESLSIQTIKYMQALDAHKDLSDLVIQMRRNNQIADGAGGGPGV
jgi:hypothetical protein